MDVRDKIKQAISAVVPLKQVQLYDDDGITGYIVSEAFDGTTSLERQELLHKTLQARGSGLTRSEIRQIIFIATLSPIEYRALGPIRPPRKVKKSPKKRAKAKTT